MATIGAYDAKTHLAQLLDRVERGERITITRHGRPVALLVPVHPRSARGISAAIEDLRGFRCGRKLGARSLRALIEEGRR
jgi:prevent-host-death family protein